MVIKSGKENLVLVFVIFICFAFLYVLAWSETGIWHYGILGIGVIVTVRYWIMLMRKLIMDEQGCTVSFLWFKKKYYWNQLKVKRIESYEKHQGYSIPYTGGVIFSKKSVYKPIGWTPLYYNWLFHPFSFFFVNFAVQLNLKRTKARPCPPIYEIKEEVFLSQMQEWGVELEDTRKKYRRR